MLNGKRMLPTSTDSHAHSAKVLFRMFPRATCSGRCEYPVTRIFREALNCILEKSYGIRGMEMVFRNRPYAPFSGMHARHAGLCRFNGLPGARAAYRPKQATE